MPQHKQPPTLRELNIWKIRDTMYEAVDIWTNNLCLAVESSAQDYRKMVQNVTEECGTINAILSSLPAEVSEELTAPLVRMFIDIVTFCEEGAGNMPTALNDEEMYKDVCKSIVKSVALPTIRKYETGLLSSGFQQELIIETFSATRNLTHLFFDTETNTDNSALLASNIHYLTHLVTFQYNYHCTDEVVEQLALHCSELQNVDISHSPAVTYVSVYHLINMRNLTDVMVRNTSITSEFYGVLVAVLPNISVINLEANSNNIVKGIPIQNLRTITKFNGIIQNIGTLAHKCPNITDLVLRSADTDLSGLTALNSLVHLRIEVGDYELTNMRAVLQGVGHRLEELSLIKVKNINMADIIMLCSSLEGLTLSRCTFVLTDFSTVNDPDLPHYKKVRNLILNNTSNYQFYGNNLAYYVNLTIFSCTGVNTLSDDFMTEAVERGAFRNIVRFSVKEINHEALSMATVELLLNNCQNLDTLSDLKTWKCVSAEDITNLKHRIQQENLYLILL